MRSKPPPKTTLLTPLISTAALDRASKNLITQIIPLLDLQDTLESLIANLSITAFPGRPPLKHPWTSLYKAEMEYLKSDHHPSRDPLRQYITSLHSYISRVKQFTQTLWEQVNILSTTRTQFGVKLPRFLFSPKVNPKVFEILERWRDGPPDSTVAETNQLLFEGGDILDEIRGRIKNAGFGSAAV